MAQDYQVQPSLHRIILAVQNGLLWRHEISNSVSRHTSSQNSQPPTPLQRDVMYGRPQKENFPPLN